MEYISKNIEKNPKHWKLQWNLSIGVRYHDSRRGHYTLWDNLVKVYALIFATSSVAELFNTLPTIAQPLAGGLLALLTILTIVFRYGDKAHSHNDLRIKYLSLLSQVAVDGISDKKLDAIMAEVRNLEVNEPNIIQDVYNLVHNECARVMEIDQKEYIKIPWHRWLIGHVI